MGETFHGRIYIENKIIVLFKESSYYGKIYKHINNKTRGFLREAMSLQNDEK